MDIYPLMLNLHNKEVIIVGGGQVAYRKAVGLHHCGAAITVISPQLHPELHALWETGEIRWDRKYFDPSDMTPTALLIIAATNNREVNARVAHSVSDHQLVNVVDQQALSNCHVPATLRRGKLSIAISTGGASPYLAKAIKEELADRFDETYEQFVAFLAEAREHIKETVIDSTLRQQLLAQVTQDMYRSEQEQAIFLERMGADVK